VVTHPVNPSDLALALGRIPTGLYVVSTLADGKPLGFVGSFLMQVGFQPPTLCVAIANGREHLAAIKSHGKFSVSILDAASQKLMGAFFKKAEPGKSPFDGLAVIRTPGGLPALGDALAWLECELTGEHATGDHVVVFATVVSGARLREADPAVHLRKNGLSY
jgi:flavin reductase (DIM6/NTAB) family NADH-FMN oxidoreductase RutF